MFSVNAWDQNSTWDIYACFVCESVSLTWEFYFPKEGHCLRAPLLAERVLGKMILFSFSSVVCCVNDSFNLGRVSPSSSRTWFPGKTYLLQLRVHNYDSSIMAVEIPTLTHLAFARRGVCTAVWSLCLFLLLWERAWALPPKSRFPSGFEREACRFAHQEKAKGCVPITFPCAASGQTSKLLQS